MTSRPNDPAGNLGPDKEHPPSTSPLGDDAAIREAIARLMLEDADTTPLDDTQRQARVDELRRQIEKGDYAAEEKIGDIVDRLLKKWRL
ncbi:MAG TPA: hypothetical protein VNN55_12555 [bacterium]|nr:hypothetical protein [bacterium]